MPNRSRTFREIFRASNPLETEHWKFLSERAVTGGDPQPLREFLIALNRELSETLGGGDEEPMGRAQRLFRALLDQNPALLVSVLEKMLKDLQLVYQDPLVAIVFETASDVRPLLSLLADVVDAESHLLECRARAVEAFVTRSPRGLGVGDLEFEAQSMLQFLNGVLDDLGRGTLGDAMNWRARWLEGLKGISGLLLDGEALQLDLLAGDGMESYLDAALTRGGARVALEAVGDALETLVAAPTRDTVRIILRILRANAPLPPWHPAAAERTEEARAALGQEAESGHRILALVVDKTIQIVLGMASARWRSELGRTVSAGGRRDLVLSPFNHRILESALLDMTQPPRIRSVAAGLLRVVADALPTPQLSTRARVYSELFLHAFGDLPPAPRRLGVDSPEMLDVLMDALDDTCQRIRNVAGEACWSLALEHPGWFQPRHYTRLLPCLSDEDRAIRVCVMRTFQTLAGYRSRQVATVVHRLHGDSEDDEEKDARHDLEIALGITLDRLVGDVEQLQQEVQALEARRRELLDHIETQAVRVGEEIHHEVLNALGGYLATAIDEEDYPEAKRRLDDLVAELRRIMNNLYPVDLGTEGFLQTIRNRLESARAHMARRLPSTTVDLDCPPDITDDAIAEHAGGPSHLVLLYRIVLEAILNARKHSRGTRIEVRLRAAVPGTIDISIVDNGRGGGGPFVENVGMTLMRQRADEIGATIRYASFSPGGTTVVVRLFHPMMGAGRGDGRESPNGDEVAR